MKVTIAGIPSELLKDAEGLVNYKFILTFCQSWAPQSSRLLDPGLLV